MKKDELHRLTIEDIVLGEGFPWDVMDSFGRLLMKQGTSVKNQAHAQDMLDRGMYIEKSLYTKLPPVNKNRRATCRSPIYLAEVLVPFRVSGSYKTRTV